MTANLEMIRQKVQPRRIPPCPPRFAENFIKGGWRLVERLYGARTDTLIKWLEACDRPKVEAERRAHLMAVKSAGTGR